MLNPLHYLFPLGQVFNALGATAPQLQKAKRDVAQTYHSVRKGDAAPNLVKKLAKTSFNPRSLQEQFEERIRGASHQPTDWRDENAKPHLELHKKTIEHARNLLNAKK